MTRTVVALLVLALLATVAGGAQCVVRCASPVPPKCHHHSQGKQTPPVQACAAEMLAGEVRADVAVVPVAVAMVRLPEAAVWKSGSAPRAVEPAAVFRHIILRI